MPEVLQSPLSSSLTSELPVLLPKNSRPDHTVRDYAESTIVNRREPEILEVKGMRDLAIKASFIMSQLCNPNARKEGLTLRVRTQDPEVRDALRKAHRCANVGELETFFRDIQASHVIPRGTPINRTAIPLAVKEVFREPNVQDPRDTHAFKSAMDKKFEDLLNAVRVHVKHLKNTGLDTDLERPFRLKVTTPLSPDAWQRLGEMVKKCGRYLEVTVLPEGAESFHPVRLKGIELDPLGQGMYKLVKMQGGPIPILPPMAPPNKAASSLSSPKSESLLARGWKALTSFKRLWGGNRDQSSGE